MAAALRAAQALNAGVDIQVEVESIAELEQALGAGASSVLLDNFSEAQMKEAVALAAGRALLEVSGGVELAQLRWIAATRRGPHLDRPPDEGRQGGRLFDAG